jgi:hypothetical protein
MDGSDIQGIVDRARTLNPDLKQHGDMPFTKVFIDISGQVRLRFLLVSQQPVTSSKHYWSRWAIRFILL